MIDDSKELEMGKIVIENGLGTYGKQVAMYNRENLDAWILSDYTVEVGKDE